MEGGWGGGGVRGGGKGCEPYNALWGERVSCWAQFTTRLSARR